MNDSASQWTPAAVPNHIAVLADTLESNTQQGSALHSDTYQAGAKRILSMASACLELGVPMLTLGLTPTKEHWRFAAASMLLLERIVEVLEAEVHQLQRLGIAIHVLHSVPFPDMHLAQRLQHAIAHTQSNRRLLLNIVLNYDGRAEIAQALQRMQADGIGPEQITDELLSAYLVTRGLPDPDLIIQTGGTLRLGNFLLWQAAYAEYYAAPVRWLDFDHAALQAAIADYARRERRFGAVLAT
jgi:undecaprenyl diphosphate synthase